MLHTTRRPRLARVFAVVLATLVALTTVVTGGTTAAAAGPYTTDATLTNIAFVNTEVTSGSDAQLSAQWSLPNNPTTPAGFTLPLGEGIAGRGETFQSRAQDDPTTIIANCVAKTNQIECDFVDSYLEANPLGLRGTVNFWVRVTEEVTTTTEHTFRVGSATATIVVNPVGQCTENCELDWKNNKEGSYDAAKQQIMWWAHIGADEGGHEGWRERPRRRHGWRRRSHARHRRELPRAAVLQHGRDEPVRLPGSRELPAGPARQVDPQHDDR